MTRPLEKASNAVECTEHRQLEIKLVEQGRVTLLTRQLKLQVRVGPVDTMETIKEGMDEDDGIMLLKIYFLKMHTFIYVKIRIF